jgi:hypothetical protein
VFSVEILIEGMGTCVLHRYLMRVWEIRCSLEILTEGMGTCVLP